MKYKASVVSFSSKREDITHVVLDEHNAIMAKCSSLKLAEKAKAKDEALYKLKYLRIAEATQVS